MDERRQFIRIPAQLNVEYAVLPSGMTQHSQTRDVSAGGACLVTDTPLPPETQVQVAIQLPDQPPVNAIAEPVWTTTSDVTGKTQHRRVIETGVRFAEIAPRDRERVSRHLRRTLGTEGASAE